MGILLVASTASDIKSVDGVVEIDGIEGFGIDRRRPYTISRLQFETRDKCVIPQV